MWYFYRKVWSSVTSIFSLFFIQQKNESFHKFEAMPIDCVLASTIVFNKTPLYKCKFLQLYLFDCCRACNAVYAKCMVQVGALNGGPEYCYRQSYKCMCKCMDKHTPPEIPPFRSPWFTNSHDEHWLSELWTLHVRCLSGNDGRILLISLILSSTLFLY